jgi:hypothetical protein
MHPSQAPSPPTALRQRPEVQSISVPKSPTEPPWPWSWHIPPPLLPHIRSRHLYLHILEQHWRAEKHSFHILSASAISAYFAVFCSLEPACRPTHILPRAQNPCRSASQSAVVILVIVQATSHRGTLCCPITMPALRLASKGWGIEPFAISDGRSPSTAQCVTTGS